MEAGASLDAELEADLVEFASSLGQRVRGTYVPTEESRENVKYLLRIVIRDDPTHRPVQRTFAKLRVFQTDLVPLLLATISNQDQCFDVAKLLTLMTMAPAEECENPAVDYVYLQEYKGAIAKTEVITALMSLIVDPLEREGPDRTQDDNAMIELVLTLLRNVLAVPAAQPTAAAGSARLQGSQDDLIMALARESAFDVFLTLAQNIAEEENRAWVFLVLEIFHLIFGNEHPWPACEALRLNDAAAERHALSESQASQGLPAREPAMSPRRQRLAELVMREESHRTNLLRQLPTRHSHFGGVFVERDALKRSHIVSRQAALLVEDNKVPLKIAPAARRRGGKKGMAPVPTYRPFLSRNARGYLAQFAEQFVADSYNPFVNCLKFEMERGAHRVTESDHRSFMYVQAFVLGVYRIRAPKIEPAKISESIDPAGFQYALRRMRMYLDGVTTESGKLDVAGVEACAALLRELVCAVVQAPRELTLEKLCVLKLLVHSDDAQSSDLGVALQRHVLYDMSHFDMFTEMLRAFSPVVFNQRYVSNVTLSTDALLAVLEQTGRLFVLQRSRKVRKPNTGLPEEGDTAECGGAVDTTDEMAAAGVGGTDPAERPESPANTGGDADVDEEEAINRELEEKEQMIEKELNLTQYLGSFSAPSVLRALTALMAEYSSNIDETNAALLNIFKRISEKAQIEPVLYQMSLLVVVNRMLNDTGFTAQARSRPLVEFWNGVVDRMFEIMAAKPALFVDVLFWKSKKEATYIANKYSEPERQHRSRAERADGASRSKSKAWTPEEEALLSEQYPLYAGLESSLDVIASMLPDRTTRQIAMKLTKMGLRQSKSRRPRKPRGEHADGGAEVAASSGESESDLGSDGENAFFAQLERTRRENASEAADHEEGDGAPADGGATASTRSIPAAQQVLTQIRGEARTGLRFIANQLAQCIAQRESGASPDYSIVPTDARHWDLLENIRVLRLLRALGFRMTGTFWVIPGTLTMEELRENKSLLDSLDVAPVIGTSRVASSPPPKSQKSPPRQKRLQKARAAVRSDSESDVADSAEEPAARSPLPAPRKRLTKPAAAAGSDSEVSESSEDEIRETQEPVEAASPLGKRPGASATGGGERAEGSDGGEDDEEEVVKKPKRAHIAMSDEESS